MTPPIGFLGGVPNQPIRTRDDTLDAEIGHDRYADAKTAAFQALKWPVPEHPGPKAIPDERPVA
jgi:hypothetical protein